MQFLIQIQFPINGSEPTKGTSVYPDANSAEAAYYTALASAINSGKYHKAIFMLLDCDGNIVMERVWGE